MNPVVKKNRSTNFSKQDQLILVEEIQKWKKVVENKITNKVSCHEKLEAWKIITDRYNAQAMVKRSLQQLQSKYENLKTETRKTVAAQRVGIQGTGGGPFIDMKDDPVLSIILDILSHKTVFGMQPIFDSDNPKIPIYGECSTNATGPTTRMETEEYHILFDSPNIIDNTAENSKEIPFKEPNSVAPNVMIDTSSQDLQNFKPPVKEINARPDIALEIEKKLDSENWSRYTPQKLRKPVSKGLRTNVTSRLSESKTKYYEAKTRIKEEKFQNMLRLMERRNEREDEEHSRKMILLDLQIEKQKKELNK